MVLAGTRTPSSVSVVSDAARTPMAGSASTERPAAPDSTRTSTLRVRRGGAPDDEELGVGAARHHRLHAVEDEAVAVAGGGGLRGERVEQRSRLGERERRGRDVVAGEGREVGLLLLVGAPGGDRGGDGARGEVGDGQPEVALGQRLGHQRAGHHRALLGDAAERLGHAEQRQPDLVRGLEHLVGGGAGDVRVGGGRAQHLGGELGDHVDEHLLVLGRREVEDAARPRRRGAPAPDFPRWPALAKTRPARRRGPEAAAGHREDRLLGLPAQPDPVEEVALGQPVHRRDGVARSGRATRRWRCRAGLRDGGS